MCVVYRYLRPLGTIKFDVNGAQAHGTVSNGEASFRQSNDDGDDDNDDDDDGDDDDVLCKN